MGTWHSAVACECIKCSGMAAPLVTFRQMVPGLKGMKRIFDSLRDNFNFNAAIFIFFFNLIICFYFQAASSAFPGCSFLLTPPAHLMIFLHHL